MSGYPPRGRRLLAVAALAVVTGTVAFPGTTAAASVPPQVADTVPVMIVLDASGSMKQDDAPGIRMDAAKTAVTNLINSLPVNSTVGLMVYGTGTGSTDAEKAAGCADIDVLTPVGPLDPAAMTAQVNTVQASGYTPIGGALQAAADALPVEGPRSIVLVSDGEDTCAPPTPCDVAAGLEQQGVDLTVHTVGFKVDEAARQQLSCIAESTGGTFADASDAGQLEQALKTKVDYALDGYTLQGTPVVGDDQASEQAPLLAPGQYTDTYALGQVDAGDAGPGRNGTTKYYTVGVQPGFRPYISATMIPPDDAATEQLGTDLMGVELTLLAKDSTECANRHDSVVNSTDRLRPSTTVLNGPTIGGPGYRSKCNVDGVQILEVKRTGELLTDLPMTMEIVIRMEPPADAAGVPAAVADTSEALATPVHGTATPISGGHSFNDAADLISGSTYADTVSTGESRYYKFPVQWGQRFSYQLSEVGTATPLPDSGGIAWVDVFNPVRQEVGVTGSESGQLWYYDRPGDPFTGSSEAPARYTNRDSSVARHYELDGYYYLRIDADMASPVSTANFLITVVVSGDVEPGPVYQPAGTGATTGTSTDGTTSASTTVSTTSTSTGTSTTTSAESSSSDAAGTAGSTSEAVLLGSATGEVTSTGSSTAWIVSGAVALTVLGVVIWWLTRRRPTPPASHW